MFGLDAAWAVSPVSPSQLWDSSPSAAVSPSASSLTLS